MRKPTEDVGPEGRLRATADGPRHPELGPRHPALGRQTLPSCPLPSPGIGTGASGVRATPSSGSTKGKCVEIGRRRRRRGQLSTPTPPRSNPSSRRRSPRKLRLPCRCLTGDILVKGGARRQAKNEQARRVATLRQGFEVALECASGSMYNSTRSGACMIDE